MGADIKTLRQVAAVLREDHGHWFEWSRSLTERCIAHGLAGHCVHAARVLAEMIGGTVVRGTYHGEIAQVKNGPWWELSPEFCRYGYHTHSWVEKNGEIYDPTWWAFTMGKPGVYRFPSDDPRYKRGDLKSGKECEAAPESTKCK